MKRFDSLLPLAAMLAILSCSEKQDNSLESGPEGPRIVLNTAAKWNQFNLPAYIGDLSAYPADLQTVINDFFPRRSTLEDAKVLFVGAGELTANAAALADAADRVHPWRYLGIQVSLNQAISFKTLECITQYFRRNVGDSFADGVEARPLVLR